MTFTLPHQHRSGDGTPAARRITLLARAHGTLGYVERLDAGAYRDTNYQAA